MSIRGTVAGICGAALLVPLSLVVASPVEPIAFRALLAGLWLLAAVAPQVALLALTLLVPFGAMLISVFDAPPMQFTEALVIAALSGALLRTIRPPDPAGEPRPSINLPALLFSGVVVASLAVVLGVSQAGLGVRWYFMRSVAAFLARDYLLSPSEQWASITSAVRLLESTLLLVVVARYARRTAGAPERLMTALAIAGTVAAGIAVAQLISNVGGAPVSLRDLATRVLTSRVGANVRDTNAAGSFFAMTAFVAVALALRRGPPLLTRVWAAFAMLLFAALWLSGSRAAVVAVVAVLLPAAAWAVWRGSRGRSLWWIAAIAAACVLGAVAVGFDPRALERRGLLNTLDERVAFLKTGFGIIAAAPSFGIGVGRYFEVSGGFMPQSIYWFHFHENAHNNFLQIGGELGLIGLAAFLWLLAASALRIVRGLRAAAGDRLLGGAAAALLVFIVTWMAGHPLLTPEVAFPFWILLGATVARSDIVRAEAAPASAVSGRHARGARGAVLVALLILAASAPWRIRQETASLKPAGQSFGFYEWEGDPGAGRFRWTTPNAAFFISARIGEMDIPISAAWANRRTSPTVLTIRVDGKIAQRIELTDGDWRTLPLRLAPAAPGQEFRRVDIITTPPWSPAAVLGSRDSRVLGVQVGEVIMR